MENTLRSFELAVEQGADGVELDIRRSRDGVPIVLHDATLDRTTTARGPVDEYDWQAIESASGGTIPSFEHVAEWASRSGAWLNVEFKEGGAEADVVGLLAERNLLHRAILSSFDASIVEHLRDFGPQVTRYLLTERWDDQARRSVGRCGAQGVCIHVDAATDSVLDELSDGGLPVVVWTVNDPARVRHLVRRHVAAVISDYPAAAVSARAETIAQSPGDPRS